MIEEGENTNLNEVKLIPSKVNVVMTDSNTIKVDGYQLDGYHSFDIREFNDLWILSVNGKLITYGSYSHIIDTIGLIIKAFPHCCNSTTSIVYFLTSPQNNHIIKQIMSLRKLDINKGVSNE